MTTYRNSYARFNTTGNDAGFRGWVQDFVATLQGAGWGRLAQVGELDENTVTLPASSTTAGWQVWYLNDSLHSTYPIYMKVTWGRGNTSTKISLSIQFGYQLDGSGTFVGWSTNPISMAGGAGSYDNASAAVAPSMGSTGEGYAWFINGRGAAASGWPFTVHIAREFDSNGEVVNNGNWSVVYSGPATNTGRAATYCVNREWGTVFFESYPQCAVPFDTTLSGSATETELWRHYMKFPSVTPMTTLYTYMAGDIQVDSQFTCSVSGVARTYLPTGVGMFSRSGNSSHMAAMIWE